MAKRKHLNIASISDVHLFHPSTPTEHILARLTEAFPDTEETGELDIIFIPGDFFDRINTVSSDNVVAVIVWMTKFFRVCAKRNVMIRVMEGTPSHDRGQPILFKLLADSTTLDLDVKYIDVLTIEHIDKFNIDVLYIPDEWKADHDEIWMDVKECLAANGLKKVDYTLMHGYQEHQVPPHLDHGYHKSKRYISITRKYILSGHIHQMSRHKNILVAGSFDRTCHGDEGAKGHWRIKENGHGDEITFVINKKATIYTTVDCKEKTISEILNLLETGGYKEMPDGSNIRLELNKGDDGINIIDELNDQYDNIKFTTKVINPDLELIAEAAADEINIEQIPEVNASNINELTLSMMNELGKNPSTAGVNTINSLIDSIK